MNDETNDSPEFNTCKYLFLLSIAEEERCKDI